MGVGGWFCGWWWAAGEYAWLRPLGTHPKDLRLEVCVRRSPTFFSRANVLPEVFAHFFAVFRVWRASRVGCGVETFIFEY